MSDVYVVRDGATIVGISTKQQGAELIRIERAQQSADASPKYAHIPADARQRAIDVFYGRMHIENHELQDDGE